MKSVATIVAINSLLILFSCQIVQAAGDPPLFDFEAASQIITAKTKQFTESHITGDLNFLNNVFTENARA